MFADNNIVRLKDKYLFAKDYFTGKTREFILFTLLKNTINNSQNVDSSLYTDFKKINTNELYRKYLEANVGFIKNILSSRAAEETFLLDSSDKTILFQDILKQYQGSLILIDFWASWCKPCIAEIPSSMRLHKQFAEKDVVFLYLSVDTDIYKWKQAETKLFINKNSYLVIKNYESLLAKNFKITGIPRYILISRDGAVINSDAPRPSSPDLKSLIEKNL